MKYFSAALLFSALTLSACSYFDSEPEKAALPGERISILDLQQQLTPTTGSVASANITVPVADMNSDWAQAGGNPSHVMQNLTLGDAAQLEQIWRADIGTGSSDGLPLTALPVVAAGKVFTMDTRSRVSAFHDQTGQSLWSANVRHTSEDEEVIGGGLAYDGGILYVTSGYNEVLALNPDNGDIYWRTKISAASRAAPTVHNGRIFINAMNNNAIALDAKSGKILWEYEGVGETTGLLGAAAPAVNDNLAIIGFTSGDLIALHVENGAVAWQDSLANNMRLGGMSGMSDIRGLPVLSGDIVIAVGYGGKMMALDIKNGGRLWQREISSAETPWIAGNSVFVLGADHQLIALNRASGEILWVSQLQKYQKPESRKGLIGWTGPLMAGGRLILTASDGRIVEFDPQNGSKLTEWNTKKTIRLTPVLASGALYLLGDDGSLLAYR